MRWNKKILVYLLTFCMVVYQTIPGMSTIAAEDLIRETEFLFGDEDDEDPAIAEEEFEGTDQSYTTEYSDPAEEASEGDFVYESLDELSDEDPLWEELIEDISETLVGLEPKRMALAGTNEITELITEKAEESEAVEETEISEEAKETEGSEENEEIKSAGKIEETEEVSERRAAEAELTKPVTERVDLTEHKEVLTERIVETLAGLDAELVTEAAAEVETEVLAEVEKEELTEVETEEITEIETEKLTEVEAEELTEVEAEVQTDTKPEEPTEVETEELTEAETEELTEVETEKLTEVETEELTEVETEDLTEIETEELTEAETEELSEVDTEQFTEVETEKPTEIETEVNIEAETEDLTEVETEELNEVETEEPTEVETEEFTEVETEELTEAETEGLTEVETEKLTEVETEDPTGVETEDLTEVETEDLTEVETEDLTEEETEDLTEEETEDLTEEETEDLTEEETEDLTEEETESISEAELREQTTYTYRDDDVLVEAELEYPEAIPDDAQLTATRVTAGTDGYNYEAYMAALNQALGTEDLLVDEDETEGSQEVQKQTPQFTSENTILYDIAFLTQNLDPETGEPDGTMKEYEPEMGSVSIKITFLKNQLEKELGAVTAEDLQVIHLPLTQEVRESVPTTMDATQITADDILIEEVNAAAESDSLDSLNMELNSLSVTAVISGTYDNAKPSTAQKTVHNDSPVSSAEIINGVGASAQFGIVANYFFLKNHMASTLAVKKLELADGSGQFGIMGGDVTQSRVYPNSYKVSVNKKVEGSNKVGNFTFGLFKKTLNGYEKIDDLTLQTNEDGEGLGIFIGDFDGTKELYVFELDDQGNILEDQSTYTTGITSYTVEYENGSAAPVVKSSDTINGSNINYIEEFIGIRTQGRLTNIYNANIPVVVVGRNMTVDEELDDLRPVFKHGYDTEIHSNVPGNEVKVEQAEGAFPFDFDAAMADLSELSRKLAKSGSSSDVDVYNITATPTYDGFRRDISVALFNDQNKLMNDPVGLSLADGRFMVINIDCSNLGDSIYYVNQFKVNGTQTSGDANNTFAPRIIFNYYTKDVNGNIEPYTGKISIDEASGIHILPQGTVTEFKNLRGSIFADRIEKNEGEIHHDPIIHASVNGSTNITNIYKGTLQHIDMPETGSRGQLLCMLAGLMMIAAGSVMLTGKKKRYQIKAGS